MNKLQEEIGKGEKKKPQLKSIVSLNFELIFD